MKVTMMTVCMQFDVSFDTRTLSARMPISYRVRDADLLNRLKNHTNKLTQPTNVPDSILNVVVNEYWSGSSPSFIDVDRTHDLVRSYISELENRKKGFSSQFQNGVTITIPSCRSRAITHTIRLFGKGKGSHSPGKAVVTGGVESQDDLDALVPHLTSLLSGVLGERVQVSSTSISHIAGCHKTGVDLNLQKTYDHLKDVYTYPHQVLYEPELHHGYMQVLYDAPERDEENEESEKSKTLTIHIHTKGTIMIMGMNSFHHLDLMDAFIKSVQWDELCDASTLTPTLDADIHETECESDSDMEEFIQEIMNYDISPSMYCDNTHTIENTGSEPKERSFLDELEEIMESDSHLKKCEFCGKDHATAKRFCSVSCSRRYSVSHRKNARSEEKENCEDSKLQFTIRKLKRCMHLFPKDKFIQSMKSERRLWMKQVQECKTMEDARECAERFHCFVDGHTDCFIDPCDPLEGLNALCNAYKKPKASKRVAP